MGRPMEMSQSFMDATHPGDRGFLQISVSPPLGIWIKKAHSIMKTSYRPMKNNPEI
jgi:hypothetical protein